MAGRVPRTPCPPAHQPTSPPTTVPAWRTGPGQLDPLPAEHPTPAAQLIENISFGEIDGTQGTCGGSGEEATWEVGEGHAGHGAKLSVAFDAKPDLVQWA